MTEYERKCLLLWDEMSIRTLLEYNSKADVVEGYQDIGSLRRTRDWANHALVFMLRGLKYLWKQPIAYVVSHGSVSSNDLTLLITDVITAVIQAGLLPKSVTCDQGPTNRKAVADLSVAEAFPFFEVMGRKIFFTYDVPHLMKSIRNNLHNEDFIIDGKVVSWCWSMSK
ncbi:uncharacterized protein LOC125502030 [Athalia rosae]|uniref:uncharacterized protein LOC125502030 n=1 Tax=Athalia rosae TaxID=37344 RepID=UPI00203440DB|nr:uncharacterized protein LOC125502030 [Athalia rosae]